MSYAVFKVKNKQWLKKNNKVGLGNRAFFFSEFSCFMPNHEGTCFAAPFLYYDSSSLFFLSEICFFVLRQQNDRDRKARVKLTGWVSAELALAFKTRNNFGVQLKIPLALNGG